MSSTGTHFTESFPKRANITGSPKQAFHMLDNRDKYYKYLLGGISAGTIAALGTIAPGGSFLYLYVPQIYHDLGGEPIGIFGTSSNKMGELVQLRLHHFGQLQVFPFCGDHGFRERAFEAPRRHSTFIGAFEIYERLDKLR